jgi:hypothetical protein
MLIVSTIFRQYNATMFGEAMDLSEVLKKLKRADEALTEFVAPLWPGVALAAVWIEGRLRLFHLAEAPETEGYYLLGTEGGTATVVRSAEAAEVRQFRELLEKASVILLEHELAFPASFAERLQGITAPRPIHFAEAAPLQQAIARFDGINLFFDSRPGVEQASPFAGLFGESSIFTPGELLGIPGQASAGEGAGQAQEELQQHPERVIEYRLKAVLEPAGAVLCEWSRADDGIRLSWRKGDEVRDVMLHTDASPITSGICLPGARGFDSAALTRLLIDHALDCWSS